MGANDRRVIRWMLLALLAVFAGMYVATYLYTGSRLPNGTTVDGIRIGGMLPGDAERKLRDGLGGRAGEPLVVSADGDRVTLSPIDAGLRVDVDATVDAARPQPSMDPRRMWDHFAGGEEQEAVVQVDRSVLERTVAEFADRVDDRAVEGAVRFSSDGEATAQYPEVGTTVDRNAAVEAVRAAFLHANGPGDVVRLPTLVTRSTVTKAAVSKAMDEFANPATSGPVTVRLAGRSVRLQPEDYAPALRLEPVGSTLRPTLDGAVLLEVLRPKLRTVVRSPRDATVAVVRGRPRVVAARAGRTFDPDQLTSGMLAALTQRGPDRVVALRSVASRPAFSTADARRLRITQRVSTYTTRFPDAAYRNQNLGRAAHLVDGTVIEPGETFSLNRTVGQRTRANGFTKGFVISNGVYAEDLGGGVSQVATTLYNAAFFAGLKDVEHKAHSFYIDRYPVGREATVVWPDVDLKFQNTTPYGVLVHASVERSTPRRKGVMRVTMWSTKYWDVKTSTSARFDPTPPRTRRLSTPGCVPNRGYDGFRIDVHRMLYRHGSDKLSRKETTRTTYTPSDTVTCS